MSLSNQDILQLTCPLIEATKRHAQNRPQLCFANARHACKQQAESEQVRSDEWHYGEEPHSLQVEDELL